MSLAVDLRLSATHCKSPSTKIRDAIDVGVAAAVHTPGNAMQPMRRSKLYACAHLLRKCPAGILQQAESMLATMLLHT